MKKFYRITVCIGFLLIGVMAKAQVNLSSSLTACYALDASAAEPVNSLTGLLSAVSPTSDRFNNPGSACNFTGGVGSFIQLPISPLLQPTTALTFATWVKFNSLSSNQYVVFCKNNSSSNFEAYALAVANTGSAYKFRVHKGDGTGTTTYTDAVTSLSTGIWYHVAFTMDNSSIKIYVNGVLENTNFVSYGFNYQTGKSVILGGSNESSFNLPLNGSLDNVKFYNRVLSSTEISALYTNDPNCANYLANAISNSLTACYALNGNAAEPINALTGTLSATTPTVDRNNVSNAALQFTGTSSSAVLLPDVPLLKPANAISFSAWIKPINAVNGYILFTKNSLSSNFEAYNLCLDGTSHFMTRKCGPSGVNQVTSTNTVAANVWYHVATTIDNAAVKLYVNGVLQGSTASTFSGFDYVSGKNVVLGGTNEFSYNAPFSGTIDNARFYNRTLSPNEILYLYNNDPVCITNTLVPASAFTSPSVACVGMLVNYFDNSLNSPTSWNWQLNGAATTTASGQNPVAVYNSPGVYVTSLTASNGNGSGNTYTQSITIYANPSLSLSSNNATICSGQSFSATVTGASTYTWSNGSNASSVVLNPTNTSIYVVTGQSSVGCFATSTLALNVNNPTPITIASTANTLCAGQSAFVLASGASSYTWNTGAIASAISVTPNITTNYTVSATNSLGCTASATTAITVYALPTVALNNGTICAGNVFTFTPTGASTYTIGGGSYTVSPLSNTSYTLIGTSAQGCLSSNTTTANITVNVMPTVNVNSGFVCAGSSFTLTPTGASFYTIVPGGLGIVNPTSNSNYTVFGSNGNACVSSAVANVAVVSPPLVSISAPSIICIGNSANLIASGANLYSWDSGATTSSIVVSPSTTSTYTVSGANLFGCISTATVAVAVSQIPSITVNSGSICAGNNFTMVPTGATSYTFSSGSSVVSPVSSITYTVSGSTAPGCVSSPVISSVTVQALPTITVNSGAICIGNSFTISPFGASSYSYSGGTPIVSPVVTSSYTVIGSGAGSCTNTAVSVVTVNPLPNLSISAPTSICNGAFAALLAGGAASYTWSTGSNLSTITVTPTTNTIYTLQGSSANNCVNVATVSLLVNNLPIISVNSGSVCLGKSFTLTPSGALTYTYSSGSNIVTPSANTNYSVSGTSAQGCLSAPVVASVIVMSLPSVALNSGSICSGGVFTLNASGALSYTYSSINPTVSPTATSIYTVIGLSANTCSNSATATVSVLSLPVISISSPTGICLGATAGISASGASTYTWSTGSNASSISVSPIANTVYTVFAIAANSCSNSTTVSLAVNSLPTISVNSGSICLGKSFTIVPSGALNYSIAGASNVVSPLSNSAYTVIGSNAFGCLSAAAATAVVNVASLPTVAVNSGSICSGQSFTIIPSGAFSYSISGGSNIISPLTSSAYTVIGANANGCVSANTATANITVMSLPTIAVNAGSICVGQSFTISPSGANSYTYSGGSNIVSPTSSSAYTVNGSSAFGCIASSPTTVNVFVNPLPTLSVSNGTICSGQSFTITPSGASSYSIQGGSFVVSPIGNSTYTINGMSSASCLATQFITVSITVNALPTVALSSGTICNGQQYTLNASGASSYTYSSGSAIVNPSVNTTYSVTGVGANGCLSANTATATLVVNASPSISASSGTICNGQSFTINAGGANTYTYQGGSAIVSPSVNASYTVTGSSALGCQAISPATVNVVVNPLPTIAVTGGTICQGQSFTLTPSGAQSYTVSGGLTVVSPSLTTTYSISGTNSLACVSAQSALATITVIALPQITISANPQFVCLGESTTLTASGAGSYTWSTLSTQSVFVSNPTVTTSYSLIGSNANACTNNASITVQVDACLGLKQNEQNVQFVVYPNPSKGIFNVRIDNLSKCDLNVFNTFGERVFIVTDLSSETIIDLSAFAKGIYFLELKASNQVWIQKVIVE